MRNITYISGTRADFGLIRSTLLTIDNDPELKVNVCATGMHFFEQYGMTIDEIVNSGLDIGARVIVEMQDKTGSGMAHSIANMLHGLTDALENLHPDIVIVLGDRGEMLAGAIAALHLNIPIVHIHGGERSGTVDEPIRHAISKLSHYHFVTTEGSRQRLIRMGEKKENIHKVGAPGLDDIYSLTLQDKPSLFEKFKLNCEKKTALVIYHPVVQDAENAGEEISIILDAVNATGIQTLVLMPNSDAGAYHIRNTIERKKKGTFRVIKHMQREDYLGMLSHVDVLIGNSSSGIIEAASLGTPVVNIGTRQDLRERNDNVIDVALFEESRLKIAINDAIHLGKNNLDNVYGDGTAASAITNLLKKMSINKDVLKKSNTY